MFFSKDWQILDHLSNYQLIKVILFHVNFCYLSGLQTLNWRRCDWDFISMTHTFYFALIFKIKSCPPSTSGYKRENRINYQVIRHSRRLIVCNDSWHFNFEEKWSQNKGEWGSQVSHDRILHNSYGVRRNHALITNMSKDLYLGYGLCSYSSVV